MRKRFIIYGLVIIFMVGLIPIGVSAEEENNIYEIVIYPNGNDIQTLNINKASLMLGDIAVNYDVNYSTNQVNIYFEKPIVFIVDVISRGNTIHNSIKFNSEDNIREVNKDLVTSGFSSMYVESINLSYEDVSKVESIEIFGVLGSNVRFNKDRRRIEIDFNSVYRSGAGDEITLYLDGNGYIESYGIEIIPVGSYSPFTNLTEINLPGGKDYFSSSDAREMNKIFIYIDKCSEDTVINSIKIMQTVVFVGELRISDYLDEEPPEEVSYLNYIINYPNVLLSWINPLDDDFAGVNIYRNGELIVENFVGESYIDEILENGIYEYKVTTLDDLGNESEGIIITITIEKSPEEVANLNYIVEGNRITLTWINPGTASFEGVNIYRDGELIETTINESFSEVLSPGTYKYKITTMESGKESEGIIIDVSIYSAPTTVKNIRIINKTSTGGVITWDLNPAFENVEKYVIYVNGEKHGEIESPPYPLEGLEEGKTYNIGVRAINSYGESEPPATIIFTPTKLAEIGNSINIGDIFAYISMLFSNMWPLLALALAIIISPKIYNLIKTNVT